MKLLKRTVSILLALLLLTSALPLGWAVSAADTVITEVRATVATPVVGASIAPLSDTYTLTEGVKITELNWTKSNGAIYPSGSKFMAGVTYYCDMEFTVKEGYIFPNSYTQLKGYINGVAGEISTVYYTDHAYVTVAFTPVSDGEVFVAGIGMNDGDYLPVGSTSTTKSKVSDRYAFYNDGVLTLHNYSCRGTGRVMPGMYSYFSALIVGEALKEIVVEGRCDLTSTSDAQYGECIWFKSDEAETPDVLRGSDGSLLNLTGPYMGIESPDGITIQDANLSIKSDCDGIQVYGDTIVKNSTVNVNAGRDDLFVKGNCSIADSKLDLTSVEGFGLCLYGDTTINNSTIDVNSDSSAIFVGIDDWENPNSCDLSVMNSDLTLDSNDAHGIYVEETVLLYNSTVNVESMDEGIYALKDLSINGSQASILTSSDSAVYCRNGNMFILSSKLEVPYSPDDGITFYGDTLYITASQVEVAAAADCGIDSAGDVIVAGSTLSLKGCYGMYSDGDVSFDGCEVTMDCPWHGIWVHEADITIKDSNLTAVSIDQAVLKIDDGDITFGEGLTVKAATQKGGALEAFDKAKLEDYRLIQVSKVQANPLTIVTQPKTSTYGKEGDTVKVTVKAEGDGLTYQWYIKNAGSSKYSKSSVTSATYSVKLSASSSDRRLYCVITDQHGNSVKTDTVLVRRQATVTKESATIQYAQKGAKAAVKVTAVGDGLKYTWYVKNDGASKYSKSSVTSASYSVTMADKVKNRRVYCVVTDKYGKTATSKTFILRESVSITTQPKTVTVKKNATAKVTVKAGGDGLKYTWYVKNEGASKYSKSSVTKSTYSVKMTAKVKNRLVYCVVTDKYGNTVKSKTVRLKMK